MNGVKLKKIVVSLFTFSALAAGFAVASHPSPAAQATYSSRQIFDATMAGYVATFATKGTKTAAPSVAEVARVISARNSGFLAQFGTEMTSGDPRQVSRAISDAASQVRTVMQSSNAVSATKRDVASTLVVVVDDEEDQADIYAREVIGQAVTGTSDYRRESLAANLARKFAGRLAPAAD